MLIGHQVKMIERFVETNARPLDLAFFKSLWHREKTNDVNAALKTFQNEDGGFGHGIEPDLRAPQSTPIGTWMAFQYLKKIDNPDLNLIRSAFEYFLQTFDRESVGWPVVTPGVDDHPHAPWWSYDKALSHFKWGNPSAAVLGFFYRYGEGGHDALIEQLSSAALVRIAQVDPSSFNEVLCFQELYEVAPIALRDRMRSHLEGLIVEAVEPDPEMWRRYRATPLTFVHSPSDAFTHLFEPGLIEQNLDLLEETLEEDHWPLNWSWSGRYPDAWLTAEREGQGLKAVENLTTLANFNRLESA